MTDVARAAGVSLKTVSRVVNGVETVDPALAARVAAAIAELGYRHNLVAAGLKAGSGTRLIGLIATMLSDPFYGAVASAVDAVARARGFGVLMTGSGEDPRVEERLAHDLCTHQVRGLIVVPAGGSVAHLAPEVGRGLRVVCIDRPAGGVEADTVLVDNRALGRAMGGHLAGRGHRRVGVVLGSERVYTHRERFAGIREGLAAAGIELDPGLVVSDADEPDGALGAALRILTAPDPPTAVLTTNNRVTLGVLTALGRLGRRVELVGFDDPEYSGLLPLPVTLVAQDPAELGRVAAERLFARLDGDGSPARRIVVPARLVSRGGAWVDVGQESVRHG